MSSAGSRPRRLASAVAEQKIAQWNNALYAPTPPRASLKKATTIGDQKESTSFSQRPSYRHLIQGNSDDDEQSGSKAAAAATTTRRTTGRPARLATTKPKSPKGEEEWSSDEGEEEMELECPECGMYKTNSESSMTRHRKTQHRIDEIEKAQEPKRVAHKTIDKGKTWSSALKRMNRVTIRRRKYDPKALNFDTGETEEEKRETAQRHKNEGNEHFKLAKYRSAVEAYSHDDGEPLFKTVDDLRLEVEKEGKEEMEGEKTVQKKLPSLEEIDVVDIGEGVMKMQENEKEEEDHPLRHLICYAASCILRLLRWFVVSNQKGKAGEMTIPATFLAELRDMCTDALLIEDLHVWIQDEAVRSLLEWMETEENCEDLFCWLEFIVDLTQDISPEESKELSAAIDNLRAATAAVELAKA